MNDFAEDGDSLLKWFQLQGHRGHLKRIQRKNGVAYLYRCRYQNQSLVKNFPAGTDPDFIKSELMRFEAEILRVKLHLQVEVNAPRRSTRTLNDLLVWYLQIIEGEQLAAATKRGRLIALRKLIGFLGEGFCLAEVSREKLNEFKRELLRTQRNGAYWQLQKLQSVFRKANYEGFMEATPFFGFQYPRLNNLRNYLLLTPEEMFAISKTFTSKQGALAWNIARFTGIRGNDLVALQAEDFDFERRIIRYRSHKLNRFEGAIMHPQLLPYFESVKGMRGRILNYVDSDSLGLVFRKKITRFKSGDLKAFQIGCHTPRRSLGAYLRNVAKWPKENIKIFLGHHGFDDDTDLYTFDSLEIIRQAVNALPFG